MTIIEQLEQSVSLPILGDEQSIAKISLLEQFYALLIARLASANVYSQLLQSTAQPLSPQPAKPPTVVSAFTDHPMFMQLWQDKNQRQLIVDELAVTHHIDTEATVVLIASATTLAYHKLKELAKGQFLPAYLQQQQSQIRHYLPIWAESVLTEDISNKSATAIDDAAIKAATTNKTSIEKVGIEKAMTDEAVTTTNENENTAAISSDNLTNVAMLSKQSVTETEDDSLSALQIPIDNSAHSLSQISNTRQRNKRNDLLLRLFLLVAAIAALALLWLLVVKPNYINTAEPVLVETAPIAAAPEAIVPVLTPVELLVAVDDSGRLYTCSATIGDSVLQESLKQALAMSFGEQASLCSFTIKAGVANDLNNLNVGLLPSLFTLLRSVPFARLQLQNNVITIESPDDALSQRLLMDMRALAPTAIITTTAPLAATQNNTNTEQPALMPIDEFEQQNSEQAKDTVNDQADENSFSSSSNADNDAINTRADSSLPSNNSSFGVANRAPINDRTGGNMSTAEADDLANSIIVAEQLRNEARVEPNATAK